MAIKDFIYPGTYTKIAYLNFSRENRILSLQIQVYNGPAKEKILLSFGQQLNGWLSSQKPVEVDYLVTTNERIIELIPDFKDLAVGETVFVQIENPLTKYIETMVNKVIERSEEGQLSLTSPLRIIVDGVHYQRVASGGYEIADGQKFESNFDEAFAADQNIEVAAYQYLMSLPIFQGCGEY